MGHIDTIDICEACHSSDTWAPVITIDHDQVNGSGSSCHSLLTNLHHNG